MQSVLLDGNLQRQLIDSLVQLNEDIKRIKIPSITSDRRKCAVCAWKDFCNNEAMREGHLSEVSGIGAKRKQILHDLRIYKLEDLAKTNPIYLKTKLDKYGEQHSEIAERIIRQAKSQSSGFEERLDQIPALPEIVNAPGILLYDIESDPDARDDFLHGFVRLSRKNNGEWDLKNAKYHPILVLAKHGKNSCWKRLENKLNFYKDWPIMHYGETELISLLRLAKSQSVREKDLSKLSNRFIDVHARLKLHWRLPLNSYGLKTVATWTGFQWHQHGADGARALLWWRQWSRRKNRAQSSDNALKWLLKYNQDDCLATWSVAKWLLEKDSFIRKNNP